MGSYHMRYHSVIEEDGSCGFLDILVSLDFMLWQWKNCPNAWPMTHYGRNHKPTLILEAVPPKDLWIWHSFLGMVGSRNSINILDHSPLFDQQIQGRTSATDYIVNGH